MNWDTVYILFGIGVTIPITCLLYKAGGDKRKKFDNILNVSGYTIVTLAFYPVVLGWMISSTLLDLDKED